MNIKILVSPHLFYEYTMTQFPELRIDILTRGATRILVMYTYMTKCFQNIPLSRFSLSWKKKTPLNENFTQFLYQIVSPKQDFLEHVWWNRGV